MISVCFSAACLLFLSIMALIYFSKKKMDTTDNKIFSYIVLLNLIGLVIDIVGYFLFVDNNISMILKNVVSRIYLVYYFQYMYMLTVYIIYITNYKINTKQSIRLSKIEYIISAIVSFTIICLPIKINKLMPEGPGVVVVFALCGIMFFIILVFMLKNRKLVFQKRYLPMVALVFFGGFSIYISYMNPELTLLMVVHSIVTYTMFFTIENPDLKMIEQLDRAKLAAEKANRAKSDFLSNMSHEIRTPLNAIVGFSDCILEETTLEDCQTDAKDIKLASENLLEIVNGILDISKIEADKMEIVETEYNPVETFENVAKLVKPRLEDKPIELYTKFAPDIPFMLHGDGGKIRQIITNILTNAAKYTEKGSINFNVDCVNENNISTLVISIEDTGRGIKKDQIDKLFSKFERLEEDRNTTLEGTGLGLAITKRFVEMMGGKIVVHSNYGEGSKFTVYIRQKIVLADKPAHFEDKSESNSFNSIDLKDTKVLVVDDNKVNIKVALKILSNYGIVADSCNSGVECIEKIKNGSIYDLILLDDMMPKLTGGETLVELKKINGFNTPVIVLTANAIDGMKDQYLSAGFDDYLSKPIEKDELLRVLITFTKDSKKEKVVETNVALEKEITYTNYSGKKALIVDDNKINIKIASRMIDDYKFDITTCMSGDECLLLCKENTYDIIFMDYMMPDMDGIETLTNLKKDPNFNTPVICLTADAVDGSREKFLEAGFDEYISKPLDRELLDNAINKFLDKKDQ